MEKAPPTKPPCYNAVFRAEALRLASESRSTRAAARALNIDPKPLYAWQKVALPLPTDPAKAAGMRMPRVANNQLAQELKILKKAGAIFSHPPTPWVSCISWTSSALATRSSSFARCWAWCPAVTTPGDTSRRPGPRSALDPFRKRRWWQISTIVNATTGAAAYKSSTRVGPPRGPSGPAHGAGPQGLAGLAAQGLHVAHHGFHPWVALRPQPAARPAQTDLDQPVVGVRHSVSASR